ncbi:MAG: DNA repair protein RadA [Bacteroidetes bacterium]|nr:DNA repair protein RadA [Bacteroidota bacterium]
MKKISTSYCCQSCGYVSVKWQGKCPGCNSWNTLLEEINVPNSKEVSNSVLPEILDKKNEINLLTDVQTSEEERINCNDKELNRVLGGGIVKGSLILLGGDPGIGKSTLMLQLAIALKTLKVLYISGEESSTQIKLRANRLGKASDQCYILNETNLDKIFKQSKTLKPDLIIIDSIQTLYSSSLESSIGSVSQIRICASLLMHYAKGTNIPIFLIGHITKEGSLAGPKVLEHIVDTVLQFEGDRHFTYRILRTTKNRFGSTSELGIYEMNSYGLREINNPSEILLSQRYENLSGISIGSFIEGNRPLLIEVQSLVSRATYGNPQRSTTGFDLKRLNMLLAVLEKKINYKLVSQDVFLNIAGGMKVDDPALDLSVCISIVSSFTEIKIPINICFAGEVGLSGEIRSINRIDQRITEAEKLGFEFIFISNYNIKSIKVKDYKIKIKGFDFLENIISDLGMLNRKIVVT